MECKKVECGVPPELEHAKRPTDKLYYLDTVKYELDEGYTLDATPNGLAWFETGCGNDGGFGDIKSPMPVSCDEPAIIKHGSRPHGEITYKEEVQYTCDTGYTINAKAKGSPTFKSTCEADSSFSGMEECKAVVCGDPGDLEFAERTTKGRDVTFPEKSLYSCKVGYSLDGLSKDPVEQYTTCQADGTFTELAPCINIDNCQGHQCGHGECVDHEVPTGNPTEDYHCKCDKGYEEEIR